MMASSPRRALLSDNPLPAHLDKHPCAWSREDVQMWLRWCIQEFSSNDIIPNNFRINGKALCMLTKEDYCERAPNIGDVLFNCVQSLRKTHQSDLMCKNHSADCFTSSIALRLYQQAPGSPEYAIHKPGNLQYRFLNPPLREPTNWPNGFHQISPPSPRYISLIPGPITHSNMYQTNPAPPFTYPPTCRKNVESPSGSDSLDEPLDLKVQRVDRDLPISETENCEDENSDVSEEAIDDKGKQNGGDNRLLWEFIMDLLSDTNSTHLIRWENQSEFVFRIVDPCGLAKLWGQKKNKTTMTYEKLSRALRYYYRMNIIAKVPGQRLTYRYVKPPQEIQRGIRGAKPGVPHVRRNPPAKMLQIATEKNCASVEGEGGNFRNNEELSFKPLVENEGQNPSLSPPSVAARVSELSSRVSSGSHSPPLSNKSSSPGRDWPSTKLSVGYRPKVPWSMTSPVLLHSALTDTGPNSPGQKLLEAHRSGSPMVGRILPSYCTSMSHSRDERYHYHSGPSLLPAAATKL